MPGNVKWLNSCNNNSYQSQKQCRKSSFAFYQAVRDLLPVWILEDMRLMEVLHWEEGRRVSTYSPSEALLYALVHNHQSYAQYLLSHFPEDALARPSKSFGCCQASAPHLAMAVRYNRTSILLRILKTIQNFPADQRASYVNRQGCVGVERGKTPLHLACELLRPECLVLLLGHGASPLLVDNSGNTPLDTLLQRISESQKDMHTALLCLDSFSLFLPVKLCFQSRRWLLEEQAFWQNLLGEPRFLWLSGSSPPSLFILSMQVCIQTLSPARFPEALDELPLPSFLKPLNLKWKS
uniref:Ankyrin repeat domain-containing protein 9 n=1 Tax=Geotrypetes seraphini TaxID=260995 RepID=A0A6P8RVI2_GEOSA|nr:ankyrin repeat domain-containing protein 9 [Geotrypetes seraphini]